MGSLPLRYNHVRSKLSGPFHCKTLLARAIKQYRTRKLWSRTLLFLQLRQISHKGGALPNYHGTTIIYSPIHHWQTRILRLYPGTFEEPLKCDIKVATLIQAEGVVLDESTENVADHALSYSWGQGALVKAIQCGNTTVAISFRSLSISTQPYAVYGIPRHLATYGSTHYAPIRVEPQ